MSTRVCDVCGDPGHRETTKCAVHYAEVFARLSGPYSARAANQNAKTKKDAKALATAVHERGELQADAAGLEAVKLAVSRGWVVQDGNTLRPGPQSPPMQAALRALLLARAVHAAAAPMSAPAATTAAGMTPDASNREKVIRYAIDRGWIERPKRGVLVAGAVKPPGVTRR